MGTPNVDNYTLGRGRVAFDLIDPSTGAYTGERPLGNAPEVSINIGAEYLDHFSSMSGFKSKDKSVISQVSPQISFTLDELDGENWKLATYGTSEAVAQAVGDNTITITGPQPNLSYDLGKRNVGSYRVLHGTVTGGPFQVGETITGGTSTATATVTFVGSDHVLVGAITGGPFASGETITGGTSTATATTTAESSFVSGVVAVKSGAAYFAAGTDYTIDAKAGRIALTADTNITTDIDVVFHNLVANYTKIKGLGNTKQSGLVRFVSDNPEGPQYTLVAWKVNLRPDGDIALIGDDWASMSFVGDILRDEVGHPDSPYCEILTGY